MQRLGRAMARHRRWVAVAWLLIVLGAGYLNGVFSKSVSDNFRIPHAGSQDAYDLLQERFQSQNGATATVVFSWLEWLPDVNIEGTPEPAPEPEAEPEPEPEPGPVAVG